MAANFNKPDLSSLEVDAVDEYKERDVDIAKMFDGTSSTNIPTNAIKFDVTAGVLQRREGGAWVTKALDIIDATTGTLSVSRGGTGATTASAARTNLSVPPTSLTISAGTGLNGGGTLSDNRTLSVDVGTDSNQIPRNSDLGSAATTDATAYATSAQGDTADSALQSSDVGTASTKDVGTGPTNVPQNSDLGSAATTDATAYATSAQGDTADTALQPANNLSDINSAATSRGNLGAFAADNYQEAVVALGSPFTGDDEVLVVRIGKNVTVTTNGILDHPSAAFSVSSTAIPAWARPTHDVRTVCTLGNDAAMHMTVLLGGTVLFNYYDDAGATKAFTSTIVTGSIAYNIY